MQQGWSPSVIECVLTSRKGENLTRFWFKEDSDDGDDRFSEELRDMIVSCEDAVEESSMYASCDEESE